MISSKTMDTILATLPASYFLDLDGLDSHFARFAGTFWGVEKRLELERVTLKYAQMKAFRAAFLNGF